MKITGLALYELIELKTQIDFLIGIKLLPIMGISIILFILFLIFCYFKK